MAPSSHPLILQSVVHFIRSNWMVILHLVENIILNCGYLHITVPMRNKTAYANRLTKPIIRVTLFVRQEEVQRPELQCPVHVSKQFGGRAKTGSHTRPEQTVSDCVWLFHLPGRKDATLMIRGDRQYRPRRALSPEKRSFPG